MFGTISGRVFTYRNTVKFFPDEDDIICKATPVKHPFVCVNCLTRRPGRSFGGYRFGEKLCTLCYPFVHAHEVQGMLNFDLAHGTL